jgi:hypothetical protein
VQVLVAPIVAAVTARQDGTGHRLVLLAFATIMVLMYVIARATRLPVPPSELVRSSPPNSLVGGDLSASPSPALPGSALPLQQSSQMAPWLARVLYIMVNLVNLVSISVLWSLCATCYTPTAARSTYGIISAGAQIAGSSSHCH